MLAILSTRTSESEAVARHFAASLKFALASRCEIALSGALAGVYWELCVLTLDLEAKFLHYEHLRSRSRSGLVERCRAKARATGRRCRYS